MTFIRPSAAIDSDVLAAAQRGDAGACRAIVRTHERRVAGQLRAMLSPTGRAGLVEDLAQEVFLRAFRALPRFEPHGPASLATWLVTIATRVALNELRRSRPQFRGLDTVTESVGLPGSTGQPVGPVGRAIERAIADLPAVYRGAFLLRELHGLDYAEIASLCEVDLGTVKSRLSRARAKLRRALREEVSG
jgi:RNA polymerase sigma-70 factor (ECF subfamily)